MLVGPARTPGINLTLTARRPNVGDRHRSAARLGQGGVYGKPEQRSHRVGERDVECLEFNEAINLAGGSIGDADTAAG